VRSTVGAFPIFARSSLRQCRCCREDRQLSIRAELRAVLAILFVGGLANLPPAIGPPAGAPDALAEVGADATAALEHMAKTLLANELSSNSRNVRLHADANGELPILRIGRKPSFADTTGRPGDDGSIEMILPEPISG
jgi:hypothetical protein